MTNQEPRPLLLDTVHYLLHRDKVFRPRPQGQGFTILHIEHSLCHHVNLLVSFLFHLQELLHPPHSELDYTILRVFGFVTFHRRLPHHPHDLNVVRPQHEHLEPQDTYLPHHLPLLPVLVLPHPHPHSPQVVKLLLIRWVPTGVLVRDDVHDVSQRLPLSRQHVPRQDLVHHHLLLPPDAVVVKLPLTIPRLSRFLRDLSAPQDLDKRPNTTVLHELNQDYICVKQLFLMETRLILRLSNVSRRPKLSFCFFLHLLHLPHHGTTSLKQPI